jgi:MOSC domain-containing protein YiiM
VPVERIYVADVRGGLQVSVDAVRVVAGRGIEGDRNFSRSKTPGRNVTFVAAEEIERFVASVGIELDLSLTRRNIVVRGVELNDLVGREFTIGEARFRGIELCEPCSRLARHLRPTGLTPTQVMRLFAHRAGLRADVLTTATVRVGAAVHQ